MTGVDPRMTAIYVDLRCWHCRRAIRHGDDDARLVQVSEVVGDPITGRTVEREEWVCGRCWNKADVGPDVPLTYEEGNDDREGQPEFNGAFR